MKIFFKKGSLMVYIFLLLLSCSCDKEKPEIEDIPPPNTPSDTIKIDYSGIPQSDIYEVSVFDGETSERQLVFQNSCPEFELGKDGMLAKDRFPFEFFAGRTISWPNFSFSGSVTNMRIKNLVTPEFK